MDIPSTIIKTLQLAPHPEGGHYREMYRSEARVFRDNGDLARQSLSASTGIYYLLNDGAFSTWHRIRSDEMWHFYRGQPLLVHVIDHNGVLTTHRLGDALEHSTYTFQAVVPAGAWFAAELLDPKSYALVGCTVAPGFEFAEFEIADPVRLSAAHPQHRAMIERLSR